MARLDSYHYLYNELLNAIDSDFNLTFYFSGPIENNYPDIKGAFLYRCLKCGLLVEFEPQYYDGKITTIEELVKYVLKNEFTLDGKHDSIYLSVWLSRFSSSERVGDLAEKYDLLSYDEYDRLNYVEYDINDGSGMQYFIKDIETIFAENGVPWDQEAPLKVLGKF